MPIIFMSVMSVCAVNKCCAYFSSLLEPELFYLFPLEIMHDVQKPLAFRYRNDFFYDWLTSGVINTLGKTMLTNFCMYSNFMCNMRLGKATFARRDHLAERIWF